MAPMHRESLYHSSCAMYHSFDHLVELAFNLRLEVGLHLVDIGKFYKAPATVRAQVIDTGYPVSLHSGLLFFGILAAVAGSTIRCGRSSSPLTVIHQHDEIGIILARLRA